MHNFCDQIFTTALMKSKFATRGGKKKAQVFTQIYPFFVFVNHLQAEVNFCKIVCC